MQKYEELIPVNDHQIIAVDLGNTTSNILSLIGDYEAPSNYLDVSNISSKTLFPQQTTDILEFKLEDDPGKTFLWGRGLRRLHNPDGLVETRSDGNRYLEKPFKNLMQMILGTIAYGENIASDGAIEGNTINTDVSIGLPTDDYDAQRYIQNSDGTYADPENLQETDDCYLAFLKKQHVVTVNDVTFKINVHKVNIADQPQGTLISQAFDKYGQYVNPDVLNEKTTIIDFGGLTILTSQYERGRRYNKSDQINEGAYRFAEAVANRWNKSEFANPRLRLTQNHILNMLYEHDPKDPNYIVSYNKNVEFDVTPFVLDEIDYSTNIIIERLKNIKGWDTSSYLFVTGGGSHLINYETLEDFLIDYGIKPVQVEEPTTANVRGFYIIGLLSNPKAAKTYIEFDYAYNELLESQQEPEAVIIEDEVVETVEENE